MIFQSTLRRTERLVFVGVIADCIYFNPRSDERSDVHYNHQLHTLPISIHAPTNGATKKVIGCSFSGKFQSTLRRTERRTHVCDRSCHSYFNPRSDERSDGEVQTAFCTFYISIHAPTNGATPASCGFQVPNPEFQSTLRRTERRWLPCFLSFV